jgi:hypothetical protein
MDRIEAAQFCGSDRRRLFNDVTGHRKEIDAREE